MMTQNYPNFQVGFEQVPSRCVAQGCIQSPVFKILIEDLLKHLYSILRTFFQNFSPVILLNIDSTTTFFPKQFTEIFTTTFSKTFRLLVLHLTKVLKKFKYELLQNRRLLSFKVKALITDTNKGHFESQHWLHRLSLNSLQ